MVVALIAEEVTLFLITGDVLCINLSFIVLGSLFKMSAWLVVKLFFLYLELLILYFNFLCMETEISRDGAMLDKL